jgi:hypothetical protein
MSSNDLIVDTTVLRNAQASYSGLVGTIPQHSIADIRMCGSTVAADALASFDMWAVLAGRADTEGFQVLASQLGAVADELDRLDGDLANGLQN